MNPCFKANRIECETFFTEEMSKSAPEASQAAPPIGGIFETSPQPSAELLSLATPFIPLTIEIPFHLG